MRKLVLKEEKNHYRVECFSSEEQTVGGLSITVLPNVNEDKLFLNELKVINNSTN